MSLINITIFFDISVNTTFINTQFFADFSITFFSVTYNWYNLNLSIIFMSYYPSLARRIIAHKYLSNNCSFLMNNSEGFDFSFRA